MQRARRFASIAVVASLAVAGLSACRSEPSVAAYVGDSGRITEARVQEVWDDARKALTEATAAQPAADAAGPAAGPAAMPISRADIVRILVSADVLAQTAQRQNVTLPGTLPLGDYATQLRLPQSAEYVRLYAESDARIRLLREKAQQNAPNPSDDDLRAIYNVLIENKEIDASATFEQFKANLPAENLTLVKTAAAVRNEVAEVANTMSIKVNPRYQPLTIPVLEFQTQNGELRPLVTVPLGKDTGSAPVVDLQ